jgi:hypothetical protein
MDSRLVARAERFSTEKLYRTQSGSIRGWLVASSVK